MKIQLLLSYFAIALSLVFCYLVGLGLNRLINKSSGQRTLFSVFNDILVGLVIVISAYSIVITSGKTVSWIYLLVLGAYTYFYKQESTTDNSPVLSGKFIWKFISGLLLVSLALFVIHLSSLLDFKTFRYTDTNCDWQFYSQTAQYLNKGFESVGMFDNIALGSSFTPYHYFEIWIAAIFSKVFCVPTQIAINIIMPTFLGCISYIGILSFGSKFNIKNSFIAFSLLFISCVSIFSYFLAKVGVNPKFVAGDYSSVVSIFKLYSLLVFFILSLHYVIKRNYLIALTCLLFIPVASFSAITSILPIVWLIGGYFFVTNIRDKTKFYFIITLVLYTLTFVCFFLFFWDIQSGDSFTFQKISVHLLASVKPIILCIYFLPIAVLLFLLKKDIRIDASLQIEIAVTYFLLILLSLLISMVMATHFDSTQFFTNIAIPLSTAVFGLFVMKLRFSMSKINITLYVVFALLLYTSMYFSIKRTYKQRFAKNDYAFIEKVTETIKQDDSNYIYCGFINSPTFYKSYLSSVSKLFRVGEVIDSYKINFFEVCLSDFVALKCIQAGFPNDELTKEQGMSLFADNTFYKYVELEKKNKVFQSIEKSQLDFIHRYNLKYLFIENDAVIPEILKERLVVVATEPTTYGYSFYKIVK